MVAVDRSRGGTIVETRGDANPGNDPWQAELLGEHVWVVAGYVPWAGTAADLVRSPAGLAVGAFGLPVVFAVSTLRLIWRRPPAAPVPDAGRPARTPVRLTRRGRRVVRLAAVLLAALVLSVGIGLHDRASAAFTASVARGHAVTTAVLHAPTVSVQGHCRLLGSDISVSWVPTSTGETSYRVERRTATTGWSVLTTVPSTTRTYRDPAVMVLVQYTYRVTALRGTWSSPAGLSVTTGLAASCG